MSGMEKNVENETEIIYVKEQLNKIKPSEKIEELIQDKNKIFENLKGTIKNNLMKLNSKTKENTTILHTEVDKYLFSQNYKGEEIAYKMLHDDKIEYSFNKKSIIAFFNEFGIGTPKNVKYSLKKYREEASLGSSLAIIRLIFLYNFSKPEIGMNRLGCDILIAKLKTIKDQGIYWLIFAAQNGNKYSQYVLGTMYLDGFGIKQDKKRAIYWFLKSADQNTPEAISILGYCYLTGSGVPQCEKTATTFFKAAFFMNDNVAMYNLAFCYEKGRGVRKDLEIAIELYRRSSMEGNIYGFNALGYFLEMGVGLEKNYELACCFYKISAAMGYPPAQSNLGYCYQKGIGVEKNDQIAFFWFSKSAIQGLSRAQHNLAQCYLRGLGVEKNETKFLYWVIKALRTDNVYALHTLSNYFSRVETEKTNNITPDNVNFKKVVMLLEISESKNFAPSIICLSICYRLGKGVKKDLCKSFNLMLKAANLGDTNAQHMVAKLYEKGIGIEKDLLRAFKFYEKAAKKSFGPSLYSLSDFYLSGEIINQDVSIAISYLEKAILSNHLKSLEKLGLCYQYIGEYSKAYKFYLKASIEGITSAHFYVGECLYRNIGVEKNIDLALEYFFKGAISGDKRCVVMVKSLLNVDVITDCDSLAQCA